MRPPCTCFRGSYYEPPECDPGCPHHGYDEDTGQPHPPWEPPDIDPADEDDPWD